MDFIQLFSNPLQTLISLCVTQTPALENGSTNRDSHAITVLLLSKRHIKPVWTTLDLTFVIQMFNKRLRSSDPEFERFVGALFLAVEVEAALIFACSDTSSHPRYA
jgi:hypothetical protein